MEIIPIKNEDDYYHALVRVDQLWNARDGSAERQEFCALATLVMAYDLERLHRGEISKRTRKARELMQLEKRLQDALALGSGDAA